MSPMAALITATLPLRAPLRHRTTIMNQNVVDNPLHNQHSVTFDKHCSCTDNREPEMATPAKPMKMTGFLPIRLFGVSDGCQRARERIVFQNLLGEFGPVVDSEELDEGEDGFLIEISSCSSMEAMTLSTHHETGVKSHPVGIVGYT